MSFTTLTTSSTNNTLTTKIRQQDSYTGSILLSPTKKRRLDTDKYSSVNSQARASPSSARSIPKSTLQTLPQDRSPTGVHETSRTVIDLTTSPPSYTQADILRWTLSPESIAPCWAADVMTMKAADRDEFWWIGKFDRIPCRMVQILGIVVGIKVDEKQIRYTVDDGTAVIDCYHSVPRKPYVRKVEDVTDAKAFFTDLPTPAAYVGHLVRVTGKVHRYWETRVIKIARDAGSVDRCNSWNEEPRHWDNVRYLHESRYDLSVPFEIPATFASSEKDTPPSGSSGSTTNSKQLVPQTPSTTLRGAPTGTPCSVFDTPSTVHLSPEKKDKQQSPQKLRHPSKLSSHNLTVNTFSIYVKHYMDNAPPIPQIVDLTGEDTDAEDGRPNVPTTPTRKSSRSVTLMDQTPRPNMYRHLNDNGKTPRPRIQALSFSNFVAEPSTSPYATSGLSVSPRDTQPMGFTLSYLRRVPVLAELARRVVKAEEKRRAKAEREKRKLKETQTTSGSARSSKPTSSRSGSSVKSYTEDGMTGKRVKRLFQQVVVDLLKEGAIVLWDGPNRPIVPLGTSGPNESRMWKGDLSSMSTAAADASIFSVASSASQTVEEEIIPSDPEDKEEGYHPLTPAFLATHVESAIRAILKREEPYSLQGKLTRGATKETILSRLKRDDRWCFLGEWHVEEALAWLKEKGKAWCVNPRMGKWELAL